MHTHKSQILLYLFFFVLVVGVMMSIGIPTHALQPGVVDEQLQAAGAASDIATNRDVRLIASDIIRSVLLLVGTLFLALLLQSAYFFVIARGREDFIEQARKTAVRATVGLVVVLLSYSITVFVNRIILDAQNPTQQQIRAPQGVPGFMF